MVHLGPSVKVLVNAEPGISPEAEARVLAAWEESKDPANRSKPYTDVAGMFRDINREIEAEGESS